VENERSFDTLFSEAESLVQSLGYELVDFNLIRHRGSSQVKVVILAPGGTGIAECSAVHRLLHSRFQVLLGEAEPSLEVSSPGLDREIKKAREYRIFLGKGIRAFSRAKSDWVAGILSGFDGDSVSIVTQSGAVSLQLQDIAKARLDYTQEVR
jgi:ribosome maturation factor RimP